MRRGKTGETVIERKHQRKGERGREEEKAGTNKGNVQLQTVKRKRKMGEKVGCHPVCVNIPGEIRSLFPYNTP